MSHEYVGCSWYDTGAVGGAEFRCNKTGKNFVIEYISFIRDEEVVIECPYCKSKLKLVERDNHVIVGCPRCRIYVKFTKKEIHKFMKDCLSKGIFNWKYVIGVR